MSACSSGGVLVSTISGSLQRAADVDARLDALNEPARPDVEARIELLGPVEADRAVAQNVEPASLEVVVAANRVDDADQPDAVRRRSLVARRSPPSVTFSAPRPIGAPGACRLLALHDQIVRHRQLDVHPERVEEARLRRRGCGAGRAVGRLVLDRRRSRTPSRPS